MPLGGAKDEHFPCFHISCQLGFKCLRSGRKKVFLLRKHTETMKAGFSYFLLEITIKFKKLDLKEWDWSWSRLICNVSLFYICNDPHFWFFPSARKKSSGWALFYRLLLDIMVSDTRSLPTLTFVHKIVECFKNLACQKLTLLKRVSTKWFLILI